MNELDLRTKIEGLEKAIKEHNDFSNTYQSQLEQTQKMLDDYYKPELTPKQLDYDGKVQAETINLNETYDLVEKIVQKVHSLFKEVEELDTTEPDNHPVEKLQQ